MKRFIVFAFNDYYPAGGINDYKSSFNTFKDAEKFVKEFFTKDYEHKDWCQILDIETGKVVLFVQKHEGMKDTGEYIYYMKRDKSFILQKGETT